LARKYGCDARDIDLSSSNIPEEPGTINDDVQGEISNDCDAYSISLIDDKISISWIDDKLLTVVAILENDLVVVLPYYIRDFRIMLEE
jgi:hypothetical protein